MPTLERERFDRLLAVLDELVDANTDAPILVEGPRDVAALRALGCAGVVTAVNRGVSLVSLCESVAAAAPRRVILLTDWDRRGERLVEDLSRLLFANGARVDRAYRDRIRSNLDTGVNDVEALSAYVGTRVDAYFGLTLAERRGGVAPRHISL
ncbi:MAG TPA: toprim domain-containing protein [Candidatus Thermoplasmatota archaeon]|nr:toprim domain-containing protein [Candidatus Thermoplasmatota archaeon]